MFPQRSTNVEDSSESDKEEDNDDDEILNTL